MREVASLQTSERISAWQGRIRLKPEKSQVQSFFLLVIMAVTAILPACSFPGSRTSNNAPTGEQQGVVSPNPPKAQASDVVQTAEAFLKGWQSADYQTMYNLLTPNSQDAVAYDAFTQRYQNAAENLTIQGLDYRILSQLINASSAQVAYRITYRTILFSQVTRDITMSLSLEKGTWRVQWDDGLILPELRGGKVLALDTKSPARGNIYDRSGNAVAIAADVVSIGIEKGKIASDEADQVLNELANLTGQTAEALKAAYEDPAVAPGDYIPVGEVSRDQIQDRFEALSGTAGVVLSPYTGRFYANDGVASHVTGYIQTISKEELEQYLREGYRQDDRVGKAGLEKWGEKQLLGQRGATLFLSNGQPNADLTRLIQVEAKPSQSIYMTIDSKFQFEAQQAISGFKGALVVMERDTGRILALVSSPEYDPNAFDIQNKNAPYLIDRYLNDGQNRLYNRASGSGYPLGSVFKIITMAAALESGVFTPQDTLDCPYDWTEIPGLTLTDWTKDKGVSPSGVLTLPEGLIHSCNPWFYHIGYTLFTAGHEKAISEMARAFGLGQSTGLEGVDLDEPGNVPDPKSEQSAALIAIGQDEVLVNPVQVARFIAAVGNGGTLYRPQVIEKITDPDGNASVSFKPEVQGTLPVKPENLKVIQDALSGVVNDPGGTAVRAFSGLGIPVYGKTGTAQNNVAGKPHAWFAGYTDANRPDKPDIAFAIIAENAGEGSDIAAPIARRLLEVYFLGQPQRVYPWEARINVARTPSPDVENSGDAAAPSVSEDVNIRTATPNP